MNRTGLVASAVLVLAALPAAPANAAPTCSSTSPALDEEVTCTYNSGGTTDITVPSGAAYVTVTLNGAGGGGGGAGGTLLGGSGGSGARVVGQFDVDGLGSLRVVLGAGGAGGLGGSSSPGDGGAGGAYSAVYRGASSAAADALTVAGGGGGGAGGSLIASGMSGGDGAAGSTAAGGDGTGTDPGGGADGTGSGGSSDVAAGATWTAGGAGGYGADTDAGDGGGGYGGGGEGGVDPGGGGAGGSYADSTYLVGSATYSPTGGSGGARGTSNSRGSNGADGSITLTFTAAPITPSTTTTPTATYADFSYFLPDGSECTAISPQRVQVGTMVELPGVDALCQTMPGSTVAGWAIPSSHGATGYGSVYEPFPPGLRVRVTGSQRFRLVPFEPIMQIDYDANIAADDTCTPANLAHTSDDGRLEHTWVPREIFTMARTPAQAPCTPEGYELTGWNTTGDGTGTMIEPGAGLPDDWHEGGTNHHTLYAMWRAN